VSANQEIATIIASAVIVVVGVIVTLLKIFGKPDGAPSMSPVIDALHEQTRLLGEIRDRIVGMSYEQNQMGASAGRVENSMAALHRRFDSLTGPRE
jgi:hypothetical protein